MWSHKEGRDRIGNAFFFVPDSLQLCGVDFEVKNFFAENLNEKIPKRYSLVFLESLPYASTTDPALRTEADLVTIVPLPTTWMS